MQKGASNRAHVRMELRVGLGVGSLEAFACGKAGLEGLGKTPLLLCPILLATSRDENKEV